MTCARSASSCSPFFLRHGRIFTGRKHWSAAHIRWLAPQKFEPSAQQIVFQDYVDAVRDARERLERFDTHIEEAGAGMVNGAAGCRLSGHARRLNPSSLLLSPSRSATSAASIVHASSWPFSAWCPPSARLARASSAAASRSPAIVGPAAFLSRASGAYRHPARVTETIRKRLENLPKAVRDIAWKAQVRLSKRYRRMTTGGKKGPVVIAAIAREMAAFLWAIGREVEPRPIA